MVKGTGHFLTIERFSISINVSRCKENNIDFKGGSRILARGGGGVHVSDGNAQEAQSLYVRQCIIHAFMRV